MFFFRSLMLYIYEDNAQCCLSLCYGIFASTRRFWFKVSNSYLIFIINPALLQSISKYLGPFPFLWPKVKQNILLPALPSRSFAFLTFCVVFFLLNSLAFIGFIPTIFSLYCNSFVIKYLVWSVSGYPEQSFKEEHLHHPTHLSSHPHTPPL